MAFWTLCELRIDLVSWFFNDKSIGFTVRMTLGNISPPSYQSSLVKTHESILLSCNRLGQVSPSTNTTSLWLAYHNTPWGSSFQSGSQLNQTHSKHLWLASEGTVYWYWTVLTLGQLRRHCCCISVGSTWLDRSQGVSRLAPKIGALLDVQRILLSVDPFLMRLIWW